MSHKDIKIMVLGIGLVRILRAQCFGYVSSGCKEHGVGDRACKNLRAKCFGLCLIGM